MSRRSLPPGAVHVTEVVASVLAPWSIVAIPLLLSVVPSVAGPDDPQTKMLLQDIGAYLARCQAAPSGPAAPLSRSCVNEKAGLLRRQHDLHVTDAEITAQFSGRGGFGGWP